MRQTSSSFGIGEERTGGRQRRLCWDWGTPSLRLHCITAYSRYLVRCRMLLGCAKSLSIYAQSNDWRPKFSWLLNLLGVVGVSLLSRKMTSTWGARFGKLRVRVRRRSSIGSGRNREEKGLSQQKEDKSTRGRERGQASTKGDSHFIKGKKHIL